MWVYGVWVLGYRFLSYRVTKGYLLFMFEELRMFESSTGTSETKWRGESLSALLQVEVRER